MKSEAKYMTEGDSISDIRLEKRQIEILQLWSTFKGLQHNINHSVWVQIKTS